MVVLAIHLTVDLTEHVNVSSGFGLEGDLTEGGPNEKAGLCAFSSLVVRFFVGGCTTAAEVSGGSGHEVGHRR